MIKIGHRGAKGYEAENTLASFEKAIAMGADALELDLNLSRDRQLIVIHDETIDRTTNGKGAVNSFALEELKSFQIERLHRIPTLTEVLDLIDGRCMVNIEIKDKNAVKEVVALIGEYISNKAWHRDDFLVSSFNWKALEEIRSLDKSIRIGVLTEGDLEQAIAFASLINAEALHPAFNLLTEASCAKIQQLGMLVFPWTVNNASDIQRMKSLGVDGIITDFLDRV